MCLGSKGCPPSVALYHLRVSHQPQSSVLGRVDSPFQVLQTRPDAPFPIARAAPFEVLSSKATDSFIIVSREFHIQISHPIRMKPDLFSSFPAAPSTIFPCDLPERTTDHSRSVQGCPIPITIIIMLVACLWLVSFFVSDNFQKHALQSMTFWSRPPFSQDRRSLKTMKFMLVSQQNLSRIHVRSKAAFKAVPGALFGTSRQV